MLLFDSSRLHIKELAVGLKGRCIHTKNISLAFWNLARHVSIPLRQQEFETLMIVQQGRLAITINHETCELEPGMGILLSPGTEHHLRGITDCSVMDIISPTHLSMPTISHS